MEQQHEHVHEPEEHGKRAIHRVEPERVYERPLDVIPVPLVHAGHGVLADGQLLAPEETAARVLHEQDEQQHEDDRELARPDGHVLREPVVPCLCLHEVEHHEGKVHEEDDIMILVRIVRPLRVPASEPLHRSPGQHPERYLVRQVKRPCREPRPEVFPGQLPVIPRGAEVRPERAVNPFHA